MNARSQVRSSKRSTPRLARRFKRPGRPQASKIEGITRPPTRTPPPLLPCCCCLALFAAVVGACAAFGPACVPLPCPFFASLVSRFSVPFFRVLRRFSGSRCCFSAFFVFCCLALFWVSLAACLFSWPVWCCFSPVFPLVFFLFSWYTFYRFSAVVVSFFGGVGASVPAPPRWCPVSALFVSPRSVAFSALRSGGLFGVGFRAGRSGSPAGRPGRVVCLFRSRAAASRFAASRVARSGAAFVAVRRVSVAGGVLWSVSVPVPVVGPRAFFRAGRALAGVPC